MSSKENSANEFLIRFYYFGLSSSAQVKIHQWHTHTFYRCFLHSSGDQIDIAHYQQEDSVYWIDLASGTPTAFAQILGHAIENTLDGSPF